MNTSRLARSIAAVALAACPFLTRAAPSFDAVKAAWKPSDTLILDRHGELLQRVRTDPSVRRGQWLALSDISPALRSALVLSEDKRFYEHSGVDWQATSAAAWANLWNSKTRGASTLTMQLAGLLDDDLKRSSGGRSVLQKVQQTVSAQWLERSWRKDQILEAYLNLVPLKGELVGIDALSHTLFGKAAHGLDASESAVAAALVRAPNAAPARVAQRACSLLKSLQPQASSVNCEALDLFTAAALQRRDFAASDGIAPHAARQLLSGAAGKTAHQPLRASAGQAAPTSIRTSLSAPLQRFALQTLQQQLRELRGRHVEDGAVLVLDNASGQVLAWVGSSGALSSAAEVDAVTALRQPGSTLKPFLYAQALAERRLTAASLLDDSDAQIQTSGGLYIPQNYDHQFKGWVSLRTALGASLNVPAVRTLVMVSPEAFHRQLLQLGLPLKESGDYYGYSLALGSAEVSLLTLANAYRALANGGRTSPTTLLAGALPVMRPAIDGRASFIVSDILSDPLARARTFGSDSLLATRFWTAVKTGTSKDMRDNWALGYSQAYTVGVWVGNASGAPMWDVSGTSGATPIWAALMKHLHHSRPSQAPRPPPGVVQLPVKFAVPEANSVMPLEAARAEWFIQGTQQPVFAVQGQAFNPGDPGAMDRLQAASARITAPTNGTIIALDPDIPPANQRVNLAATGSGLRWQIDGKYFASGNSAQWLPWPGRHVLQITDAKRRVRDEIRLEVRGAGLAGKR